MSSNTETFIAGTKFWNRKRGFGKLILQTKLDSDGNQIETFVHHSEIHKESTAKNSYLSQNELVICELSLDDKGRYVAKNVRAGQGMTLRCNYQRPSKEDE